METVGKDVIKLDFQKGYCCQFATATSIILGTNYGLPLSTTHCMVGSLAGIVIVSQLGIVKQAYNVKPDNLNSDAEQVVYQKDTFEFAENGDVAQSAPVVVKDENSIFNKKTVYKILFFWALTLPVAICVAYCVTALLLINATK